MIKNSQPFGEKMQKTAGGIFLTHNVYGAAFNSVAACKSL